MARSATLPLAFAALALASSVACGSSPSRNDYAGAAIALGFGVAGAGVHRAATGGCYAQCTHGLVCDRESGQCVPYESLAGRRAVRRPPRGVDAGMANSDAQADADPSDAEDAGDSQ